MNRRSFALTTLTLAAATVTLFPAPRQAVAQTAPSAAIRWSPSLSGALAASDRTGQPVMLVFHADWCPWCRRMDNETLADRTVATLSRGFQCVKADTETTAGAALAERYGAESLPTVLFLNSSGQVQRKLEGFQTAAELAQAMRAAAPRPAAPAGIQWRTSLAEAQREARETGKSVMLVFHADWCPFCRRMDSETFSDAQVATLARRFLCVKVDTETPYGESLCKEYAVQAFPYVIFFDAAGRITATREGLQTPSAFYAAMRQAL